MTEVKKCDCEHKWQDEKYGAGNRLHNEAASKAPGGKVWVCTVCGKRRD